MLFKEDWIAVGAFTRPQPGIAGLTAEYTFHGAEADAWEALSRFDRQDFEKIGVYQRSMRIFKTVALLDEAEEAAAKLELWLQKERMDVATAKLQIVLVGQGASRHSGVNPFSAT